MILKRDGRIVKFDPQKIENAVLKAFYEVDGQVTQYAIQKAQNIANYIEDFISENDKNFSVEEIQDLVEHGLMSCKRKDVARAYIIYRNRRTEIREKSTELQQQIKEALFATNVQNSNANLDEKSFGGRAGTASSTMLKNIALNSILSETSKYNHLNNRVYIHDLDHYPLGDHNCLTLPLDKLLAEGFDTRQQDCRPAGSISSALQLVAVLFQLQSLCQFGGVAAGHLDWTLVPYVRKSFYKHYKDGAKYILNCDDWSITNEAIQDFNNCSQQNYKTIEDIPITSYFFYPHGTEDIGNCEKVYKYALEMTEKECRQAVEAMYHNLNY